LCPSSSKEEYIRLGKLAVEGRNQKDMKNIIISKRALFGFKAKNYLFSMVCLLVTVNTQAQEFDDKPQNGFPGYSNCNECQQFKGNMVKGFGEFKEVTKSYPIFDGGETTRVVSVPDGLWSYYYENKKGNKKFDKTKLAIQGYYISGVQVGEWKTYLFDGTLYSIESFAEVGDSTIHGEILTENHFQDEVYSYKTGKTTLYHENGNIKSIHNYLYDEPTGKFMSYYPNGVIEEEGNYAIQERQGRKLGVWKSYYDNGNPKSFSEYIFNEPTGKYLSYYQNGSICQEGEYEVINGVGVKIGVWKTFYTNGNIAQQTEFFQGSANGLNEKRYKNGNLQLRQNFDSGIKVGSEEYYSENGARMYSAVWKEGQLASFETYDHSGEKTDTSLVELYYDLDENNLAITGYIANNLKIGEWFNYYKPDEIESKSGLHMSGALIKSVGRFNENNTLEGRWVFIDTSGEICWVGHYKNGEKHGEWKLFEDFTNETIRIEGLFGENHPKGIWKMSTGGFNYQFDFQSLNSFNLHIDNRTTAIEGAIEKGKFTGVLKWADGTIREFRGDIAILNIVNGELQSAKYKSDNEELTEQDLHFVLSLSKHKLKIDLFFVFDPFGESMVQFPKVSIFELDN
jgi:antitoxin component YwqK of YwqJK toxin-antitoxin module